MWLQGLNLFLRLHMARWGFPSQWASAKVNLPDVAWSGLYKMQKVNLDNLSAAKSTRSAQSSFMCRDMDIEAEMVWQDIILSDGSKIVSGGK